VHRPLARRHTVDVQGVDAHQDGAGPDQPLRQFAGEMRMAVEVLVRPPVPVPAGVDQDGTPSNVTFGQRQPIDGAAAARRQPRDDAVKVGQRSQRQSGHVLTVGIPMAGAVHIGAGVGDHLYLADVELRAGRIVGA
jgi:hypothetical protein